MSFALDIQKFAQKCGANADLVTRKVVLDIGRSLVEKTPVGNPDLWQNPDNKPDGYVGGMARGSWSHSIGTLDAKVIETIDSTGGASIDRIAASVPVKAAGEVHYIQNSLPYMQALEDGHSTQAPNGFVGLTVIEFQSIVETATAGLK